MEHGLGLSHPAILTKKLIVPKCSMELSLSKVCTEAPIAAVIKSFTANSSLNIANGADINAKDKWDYQPIYWAAHHDRADVVELLIDNCADVNT